MIDRQPPRAAVVVIHGIGEQAGAATLGRLAQGLVDHAGASQPAAHMRRVAGETVPLLRLELTGVPGEVDLYEYPWQHLVQGRISATATLRWLFTALLAPLQFRRNWRILTDGASGVASPWLVVLRQLAFASLILLPLIAVPLALAWLPLLASARGTPPKPAMTAGDAMLLLTALGCMILALLQLAALAWDGLEAMRIRRRTRRLHGVDWFGLHGRAAGTWRLPALMGVVLAACAAWLLLLSTLPAARVLLDWFARHRDFAIAVLLFAAALVAGWRVLGWLRDYVGDIALYVTADRQPAAGRGRHAIKAGAARLLQRLLRDPEYDRVVLVGHSLGSVIAVDALNLLARHQRAAGTGTRLPTEKLAGLLTFGSPLDKVAYFFREHTGDSAAVHAQLLSFLHSTARLPSGRDDGPYCLAPYEDPLAGLRWINLHASADPISDPLAFHRVEERITRRYFPIGAHGAYWQDEATYAALKRLLRR